MALEANVSNRIGTSFDTIGVLTELADYTIGFALRAVCRLGVADELAGGVRPLDELAEATGTHAPSLLRVMRALVAKGVFSEEEPERFGLTAIGELLRTDHPLSMRWAFRLEPDVRALAGLEYSVRTGRPAFEEIFGEEYFAYLGAHSELRREFRESQAALSRLEQLGLLRSYEWRTLHTVVDIGGNDGTFLSALLSRFSHLHGTLFDLPDTVAPAEKVFADAGVTERAGVCPGNLFTDPLPTDADAYLIKRVLVGYDDDQAITLLRNIRRAVPDSGRLLVLEPTMAGLDTLSTTLDVRMLVLVSGRVRTPQEHGSILDAAGFALNRVITTARTSTILEAFPR